MNVAASSEIVYNIGVCNSYQSLSCESGEFLPDEVAAFGSKSVFSDNVLNMLESVAVVSVDTEPGICNYVPSSFCSSTYENTLSTSYVGNNHLSSTTFTTSSLPSSSAAAIKIPHCVSLKKSSLSLRGYKSFEDWNSDPNHAYIGRDVSHHVAGALGSKWGNPFKVNKKSNKKIT